MENNIILDDQQISKHIITNNIGNNFVMKTLVFAVIFTMPLTNAFALSALGNVTNLLLVFTFIHLVLSKRVYLKFSAELFLMYLFGVLSVLSMINYNDKTFIEIRGYLYIPIVFIIASLLFYNAKIPQETINKYFYKAWIFAFVFGLLDIVLVFFTSIPIDIYVIRYRVAVPLMEKMGGILPIPIYRMRSFFAEPGFYAMYLNSMTPLFLYYSKQHLSSTRVKLLIIPLVVLAYVLTFSTAGFLIAVLSFAMLIMINTYSMFRTSKGLLVKKRRFKFFIFGIVLVLILLIAWETILEGTYFKDLILYRLYSSSSVDIRSSRAIDGLEIIRNSMDNNVLKFFFGHGVGHYQALFKTTSISSLVTILLETGVVGLSVLFAVFISLIIRTLKSPSAIKPYFLFSIFSTIIHLAIIPNFYFPHIWIILAFIWWSSRRNS